MTFSVAGSSNQLSSVTGALSRTYSYDAAGHTAAYGGVSFTYNAAGRLLTAVNGSATSSYIYNALGQRVQKVTAAGTTAFVYDESGHLLGEYDGTGNAIQEIVWLGDTPVATVRQEACGLSIFYIHTDHLNTPRRITRRSTSDVVWSWDSDPFGTAGPNENPSGLGSFSFNLRFPGQYYDVETGLSYNFYRYYDPSVGGYTQSDPIGLDGGSMSTYSYVNDDPLDYIDPEGLAGGAPRRRTRACNSDEQTQCEAQCAGKGVRSCKRQQLFAPVRTIDRNGTVLTTWIWKDQGLSCDCKDPEACKNAVKNAAAALGLSVTTYLIISEGSRLFPPRNLVPIP